jgi:hypothetical protein
VTLTLSILIKSRFSEKGDTMGITLAFGTRPSVQATIERRPSIEHCRLHVALVYLQAIVKLLHFCIPSIYHIDLSHRCAANSATSKLRKFGPKSTEAAFITSIYHIAALQTALQASCANLGQNRQRPHLSHCFITSPCCKQPYTHFARIIS